MANSPIRVLVVDDSAVVRELLTQIINADPAMQVIGVASNGQNAIATVQQDRPDIVTMDIFMPQMDGFEATRRIMETSPTPIVIVTGSDLQHEVATTFRAVEAGALTVMGRPVGPGHPDHERQAKDLIQTLKLMSEVKVVRRWARRTMDTAPLVIKPAQNGHTSSVKLVAIGASTGGPTALQSLLSSLPPDFSVPIVIVQHMAAGFTEGFAQWLGQVTGRNVIVASHGMHVTAGMVYVAPDGSHLKLMPGGIVALSSEPAENNLRPAVSYFFRSVTQVYGAAAIGVLLTGMGKDGAPELKQMRDRGAATLAQDEISSVVFGMPGEAIRLDAASYVLSPEKIGVAIGKLTSSNGTVGR